MKSRIRWNLIGAMVFCAAIPGLAEEGPSSETICEDSIRCDAGLCVGDRVRVYGSNRYDLARLAWIYRDRTGLVVYDDERTIRYPLSWLEPVDRWPVPPQCSAGICVGDWVEVLNTAPENPDKSGRVVSIDENGVAQIYNPATGHVFWLPVNWLRRGY